MSHDTSPVKSPDSVSATLALARWEKPAPTLSTTTSGSREGDADAKRGGRVRTISAADTGVPLSRRFDAATTHTMPDENRDGRSSNHYAAARRRELVTGLRSRKGRNSHALVAAHHETTSGTIGRLLPPVVTPSRLRKSGPLAISVHS